MANKLVLLIILYILSDVTALQNLTALSGQQVDLECEINSTEKVTWYTGLGVLPVYTCNNIHSCSRTQTDPQFEHHYKNVQDVYRNNEASVLSLIPSQNGQTFQCEIGDHAFIKTYRILVIDPYKVEEYCNVSLPSFSINGDHQISLLCGFTFQGDLDLRANLTIEGLGQNHFQTSSESTNRTLHLDDNFNNIDDAFCEIYFPDINITRTCAYPAILKTKYVVDENGIIVQSDDESEVNWQLFGKDGREEDLASRTWTRYEGRSLLILEISEEDVGKVLVWRTKGADNQTNNGTIGFTVISDISGGSPNKPESKDRNTAPSSNDGPFFVLTLLFLALWLITFVVGGIILFCREEKCKTSLLNIPSTSGNARSPNSNQSSNVKTNGNVGSDENGTPLVRFTTEATNPDVSNTNNSAHTPVLERDDGTDDTLNRQSQGDSHLYFTLEKSPPEMSSSQRASTPRWNPGDGNTATLDQDQDSLLQGYATVGESNENATYSYDLAEYAEVGEHPLGKGPPVKSIRPPVRKKPGREEIKDEDISKLYSKVNK